MSAYDLKWSVKEVGMEALCCQNTELDLDLMFLAETL